MSEDTEIISILEYKDFYRKYLNIDTNKLVGLTSPGEWMKQTVPSIYFRSNEDFDMKVDSVQPGVILLMVSTIESLTICFELLDNPFLENYYNGRNRFIPIIKISRSDLFSYEKLEEINFQAVKPKKSLEIASNMKGAPVGGLIMGSLFKGAVNLAGKIENPTVEKKGTLFSLKYYNSDKIKSIEIICESFYTQGFEEFLKENWSTIAPPEPPKMEKKEGCFVATVCYGDYEHPKVIVLREFRDNVLKKNNLGRKFIKFYYNYSPELAKKIANKKLLKSTIRILIINPIVKLISKKQPNT
jgi:hypothetical protein